MAYLSVLGTSMAPTLKTGDLVVVRAEPAYEPGEIVAYRQPGDGGAIVVHRVVEIDGDRLVLRGDANETVDAVRPRSEDVLGRQILAIPHVGQVLGGAQSPPVVALLAVGAATAAASAVVGGPRRRRQPTGGQFEGDGGGEEAQVGDVTAEGTGNAGDDPVNRLAIRRPGSPWLWTALAAVVAVAAIIVLGSPTGTTQAVSTPWTVTTEFTWDQPANDDALVVSVHGTGGVRTGDTVFAAVTPVVVMEVATQLSSSQLPESLGATLEVTAAVASDAGWRREVGRISSAPLVAGQAAISTPVDLPAIWATAVDSGAAAGRQGEVRLELVAVTTTDDGRIAATATQAFLLDGVAATPENPVGTVGTPDAPKQSEATGQFPAESSPEMVDTGAVTPSGAVTVSGIETSTEAANSEIAVGPVTVPRDVALAGLSLVAMAVALGWVLAARATHQARQLGEASLVATRHRHSLVSLRAAPPATIPPVDVTTFEALQRVASTTQQPIGVSASGEWGADFWVTDGPRSWRYHAPSP